MPSFSAVLGLEDATTQDREASFVLGAPVFDVALGKTALGVHNIEAAFTLGGSRSFSVVLAKRIPADRTGPLAVALTNGIAILKSTLLAGGLLRSIQWRRRTGERDVRGRQAVTTTLIDALIEQRPELNRDRIDTDREDDTVLTILDPVAITDSDTFLWGDHVYKVEENRWRYQKREHRRPVQFGSDGGSIMASVLDWAYWHLARDTTRRVLDVDGPLGYIAPGQLPPGEPARQVAMMILARLVLRAMGRRPARWLAPHHAGRGCSRRIRSHGGPGGC